jgi:hypothetical protein
VLSSPLLWLLRLFFSGLGLEGIGETSRVRLGDVRDRLRREEEEEDLSFVL